MVHHVWAFAIRQGTGKPRGRSRTARQVTDTRSADAHLALCGGRQGAPRWRGHLGRRL